MRASSPARELRWALVFFAIFALLMIVLRPVLHARGVPDIVADVMIGLLSAFSYLALRAGLARRRRLLAGK